MTDRHLQILILSEELAGNADEGLKRFVEDFSKALSSSCDVQIFAQDYGKRRLARNRLLLGTETLSIAREYRHVQGVFYFPRSASATLGSLIRCWILQRFFGPTSVALVALQQKHWSKRELWVARYFWPRAAFLPTTVELSCTRAFGLKSSLVLPGVDTDRFKPISQVERKKLRSSWGVDESKPLVLHVGHLRKARGLDMLIEVRRSIDCDVFVIGSTTTNPEKDIVRSLINSGVRVIAHYVPHIEEIYQMADCYLFPVRDQQAAIAVPLSVLEAMACNLPVVSFPFGELPNLFSGSNGFYLAESEDFVGKIKEALRNTVSTRENVLALGWEVTARRMVSTLIDQK